MQLIPDADEQAVIDMVRHQAASIYAAPTGATLPTTRPLVDFGWLDMGLPVADGGLDLLGWAFVVRESERHLGSVSNIPTLVALGAAMDSGWDTISEAILRGELTCGWLPQSQADQCLLYGDGEDLTLALRLNKDAVELIEVTPRGTTSQSIEGVANVQAVDIISTQRLSDAHVPRTYARLWTLMGAAGAGICEVTTKRSAEYAKIREQFGRPIGSFQAVAHRCADMEVRSQVLWRQTCVAALSFREDLPATTLEAASARLLAGLYAAQNAASNLQNHGGVGFTMEFPEHRYVRRAQQLAHLGGAEQATDAVSTIINESRP